MKMEVKPIKDIKKLIEYNNCLKNIFGYHDWNCVLEWGEINENNIAEVDFDTYEKRIIITVNETFNAQPLKEKYKTLVHEFVHGTIRIFIEPQYLFSQSLMDYIHQIHKENEELLACRLTDALLNMTGDRNENKRNKCNGKQKRK